uniref:Protein kinase domain-containing protein n=1 Tax=Phaeomonas parva TaxID=124430 RepID=A0A7S1XWN2_9STRA|mmetsp:Transcript_44299/g.139130  ORF Transcript_44299/g.139130 Transcript_44299/m.139130 type:complete len:1255 (+) Transcript_44299:222-3986(+)
MASHKPAESSPSTGRTVPSETLEDKARVPPRRAPVLDDEDARYIREVKAELPRSSEPLCPLNGRRLDAFVAEMRADDQSFGDFFEVLASPLGFFELLRFIYSCEDEQLVVREGTKLPPGMIPPARRPAFVVEPIGAVDGPMIAGREVSIERRPSVERRPASPVPKVDGSSGLQNRTLRNVCASLPNVLSRRKAKTAQRIYSCSYSSCVTPLLFLNDCYMFRHQGSCLPALADRIVNVHLKDPVRVPLPDILDYDETKNFKWRPKDHSKYSFADFEKDHEAGKFAAGVDMNDSRTYIKVSANLRNSTIEAVSKKMREGNMMTGYEFLDMELSVLSYLHFVGLPAAFQGSPFYREFLQLVEMRDIDTTDDSFELFRVIGRGAFGKVRAMKRVVTGVPIALKTLNVRGPKASSILKSAKNELHTLSRVARNDFIMGFVFSSADVHAQSINFGFELCTGGDLKYHLGRLKRFAKRHVAYYAARLILGLHFLHRAGYVHRDLKPANIILDATGRPKLCDLGLAKLYMPAHKLYGVAGTLGYMSPEMVTSKKDDKGSWVRVGYDVRTDWFSFGATIYELFIGFNPFKPRSAVDKLVLGDMNNDAWRRYVERTTRFSSSAIFPEGVNPVFADFCSGCLRVEPQERYGANGINEMLEHELFSNIDHYSLVFDTLRPPITPSPETVHAPPKKSLAADNRRRRHRDRQRRGEQRAGERGEGPLPNGDDRNRDENRDSEEQQHLTDDDEYKWMFYNFEMMDLEFLKVVQGSLIEDVENEGWKDSVLGSLLKRVVTSEKRPNFNSRIRHSAVPAAKRHAYRRTRGQTQSRRASLKVAPSPMAMGKDTSGSTTQASMAGGGRFSGSLSPNQRGRIWQRIGSRGNSQSQQGSFAVPPGLDISRSNGPRNKDDGLINAMLENAHRGSGLATQDSVFPAPMKNAQGEEREAAARQRGFIRSVQRRGSLIVPEDLVKATSGGRIAPAALPAKSPPSNGGAQMNGRAQMSRRSFTSKDIETMSRTDAKCSPTSRATSGGDLRVMQLESWLKSEETTLQEQELSNRSNQRSGRSRGSAKRDSYSPANSTAPTKASGRMPRRSAQPALPPPVEEDSVASKDDDADELGGAALRSALATLRPGVISPGRASAERYYSGRASSGHGVTTATFTPVGSAAPSPVPTSSTDGELVRALKIAVGPDAAEQAAALAELIESSVAEAEPGDAGASPGADLDPKADPNPSPNSVAEPNPKSNDNANPSPGASGVALEASGPA